MEEMVRLQKQSLEAIQKSKEYEAMAKRKIKENDERQKKISENKDECQSR